MRYAHKRPRHPACPRFHPRDSFAGGAGAQPPPFRVERRQIPYWQERGWTQQGNAYTGTYQTPYGAFQGWIEQERSGRINFYLYNPSDEIRSHSHWTCFQHRGNDWYLVHMAKAAEGRQLGNHDHRTTDHGGLRTMKTTHLEEKRKALVEKREELIGQFNEAARSRQEARHASCTEIRQTNEFLEASTDRGGERTGATRDRGAMPSVRCFCTKASRS